MSNSIKPLVSVSCITFNHVNYIRQCIDSILMQKTTFDFELLIHDDCSTDGTTEIVKEYENKYPNIIKPLYEDENQWQKGRKGSRVFNFPRARGKYIAICEGDDYWTDPLKLQKQVDILEKYNNVSCCTHQASIVRNGEETNEPFISLPDNKLFYTLKDVLGNRLFHTATYLFRNTDKLINTPEVISQDKMMILILACLGDIYYIPKTMAVYRKTETGISSSVKLEAMKTDLNMLPYLKSLKPDFPVYRELSQIYKTIAMYSCDANCIMKIKYLSLSFIYSFSYFPYNIIEILNILKKNL